MKKISTVLFFMLFVLISVSNAQLQRNPVLEYCTGTWCQYCPCGHSMIRDNILPAYPNTIIIGYHGPSNSSDPYRNFNGNSIIPSLGYTGYPTGIVDRTSAPASSSAWYSRVASRNVVNASVNIDIHKSFNETTRQLNLTIFATALTGLSGDYKVSVVLTEDGLRYAQTGNAGCPGGSEYVHDHVVRSMLNNALGDLLNEGGVWGENELIQKGYTFTVPSELIYARCHLVVFVYKVNSPLNLGEIQQGRQWTLTGTVVPVELSGFTACVDETGILLTWETLSEKNNHGFVVERSFDGETFIPAGFIKGNGTTTEKNLYSFKDKPETNGIFYYRLKQQDYDGSFSYSEVLTIKMDIPAEYILAQNYPNPFNPSTIISYSIPADEHVTLKLYDLMGREINMLVSEMKKAGNYEISLDAGKLSSGTYYYRITAGNFTQSKKLVVLK
jgi:hypothetical protein